MLLAFTAQQQHNENMSQHFDAIFENGVLKPLEPLHLPEQSRVRVTVEKAEGSEPAEKAPIQQAALQDLLREIDATPQKNNADGWSASQHDDLLYDREA